MNLPQTLGSFARVGPGPGGMLKRSADVAASELDHQSLALLPERWRHAFAPAALALLCILGVAARREGIAFPPREIMASAGFVQNDEVLGVPRIEQTPHLPQPAGQFTPVETATSSGQRTSAVRSAPAPGSTSNTGATESPDTGTSIATGTSAVDPDNANILRKDESIESPEPGLSAADAQSSSGTGRSAPGEGVDVSRITGQVEADRPVVADEPSDVRSTGDTPRRADNFDRRVPPRYRALVRAYFAELP